MSAETENGTENLDILPPKMEKEADSTESEAVDYSPPSSRPPMKSLPPVTSPQPSAPPQPPPKRKGPQTPPPPIPIVNGTKRSKSGREKHSQKKPTQKYCRDYRTSSCTNTECPLYHCSPEAEAYYKRYNKEPVCLKYFSDICPDTYSCKYRHITSEEFEAEQSEIYKIEPHSSPTAQTYPIAVDTTQPPPPKVENRKALAEHSFANEYVFKDLVRNEKKTPVAKLSGKYAQEYSMYQPTDMRTPEEIQHNAFIAEEQIFPNSYIFKEFNEKKAQAEKCAAKDYSTGFPKQFPARDSELGDQKVSEPYDSYLDMHKTFRIGLNDGNVPLQFNTSRPPPVKLEMMHSQGSVIQTAMHGLPIDITQPPPAVRPIQDPGVYSNTTDIMRVPNNSLPSYSNRCMPVLQRGKVIMGTNQVIRYDLTQPPPPVPDTNILNRSNSAPNYPGQMNTYHDPQATKRHLNDGNTADSRAVTINENNQGNGDVKRFKPDDQPIDSSCIYCRKYDERKIESLIYKISEVQKKTAEQKLMNQKLGMELQRLTNKYGDIRTYADSLAKRNVQKSLPTTTLMTSGNMNMQQQQLPTPMILQSANMKTQVQPATSSEFCNFKEKLYKLQTHMKEALMNFPTDQEIAIMSGIGDNIFALEMLFNGQMKIHDMHLAVLKEKLLLVGESLNDVTKYFSTDSKNVINSTRLIQTKRESVPYITSIATYNQTQPANSQVNAFSSSQTQQKLTTTLRPTMSISENQQGFLNGPQRQEIVNQHIMQKSQLLNGNQPTLNQTQHMQPHALVQSILGQQSQTNPSIDYYKRQIVNTLYNNFNSNKNRFIPPP